MKSFSLFKRVDEAFQTFLESSLVHYEPRFALNRIETGKESAQYGVLLSPKLQKIVGDSTYILIVKHTGTEEILNVKINANVEKRRELIAAFHDIQVDGIKKAKERGEVQIDYLLQAAISKMLINAVQEQYDLLIDRYKYNMRQTEATKGPDHSYAIELKDKLSEINANKRHICRILVSNLFKLFFNSAQQKSLQEIRENELGTDSPLPGHFFTNPMLLHNDFSDAFFMLDEYGLLFGKRADDADKFEAVLEIARSFLHHIYDRYIEPKSKARKNRTPDSNVREADESRYDGLIKAEGNIDFLLNYFESHSRIKRMKRQKAEKKQIRLQQKLYKTQRSNISYIYKAFKDARLAKNLIALYGMQPLYSQYCPPLVPQQVLQFLVTPSLRKSLAKRLKRISKIYNRPLPLKPLRKKIKELDKITIKEKHEHLNTYAKNFSRYYRDLQNYAVLKEATDRILLVSDGPSDDANLANANIYEFQLPDE